MAPEQPGCVAFPPRGVRARCSVLVGRDGELGVLRTLLDGAARGAGAAVVLRGEAGIGKSRLARELVAAARARSMTTLVGRSLQHGQAPYRPLTEALFAAARTGPLPDVEQLRPFRHALGTIVPDWRGNDGGGEESAVVIAKASCASCGCSVARRARCWSSRTCIGPTPTRWRRSSTSRTTSRTNPWCSW